MPEKSKPVGLVVIALYSALLGLAAVLIGSADFSGAGFFVAAFGVLLLASAYGLWTLQPWGRACAWWLYAAFIPIGLLAIFQRMSAGNTLLQLLGIAIDIAVLVYLGKPEVESGSFADYERREPYLKREPN